MTRLPDLLLSLLLLLPSTLSAPTISVEPADYYVPLTANVSFMCNYSSTAVIGVIRIDKEDKTTAFKAMVRHLVATNTTDWGGVSHDDMVLESGYPSPAILTFLNVTDHHYGKYQCTVIETPSFLQGSVLFYLDIESG